MTPNDPRIEAHTPRIPHSSPSSAALTLVMSMMVAGGAAAQDFRPESEAPGQTTAPEPEPPPDEPMTPPAGDTSPSVGPDPAADSFDDAPEPSTARSPLAPSDTFPSRSVQAPPPPDATPPTAPPTDVPPPAMDAPPAIGLIPSGSMFTRWELRRGYEELGVSAGRFTEGDAVAARMRMGLRTTDIDMGSAGKVAAQVTVQASGFWGLLPQQLLDANAGLHEGYLAWTPTPQFSLAVGRLILNYGDALVIGDLDWHENGRSFDGMRARLHFAESGWLDLLLTQLTEGRGGADTGFGAGDSYFTGGYGSFQMGQVGVLEPYVLLNLTPAYEDSATDVDESTTGLATLGARFVGKIAWFDYRAEAGFQTGRHRSAVDAPGRTAKAYHADLEVGASVLANKLRIGLEGFVASGDDPDTDTNEGWNQLYPTAHKWLGLMDVTGPRTNVAGGVFHLKAVPFERLVLASQAHLFLRPVTAEGVDAYQGSEIDVGAVYTIGPRFTFRGLYGVYLPSSSGPLASSDVAHYVETELRLDF